MTINTERREVHDFDEVSLRGYGDVLIEQGETESLTVEAAEELMPRLGSRVDVRHNGSGRLVLDWSMPWYEWLTYWFTWIMLRDRTVRYHVTVKNLNAVSVSGAGSVTVARLHADRFGCHISGAGRMHIGELSAAAVDLRVSGSGDVALSGKAERIDARISGSGRLRARGLELQDAVITISGSGDVEVNAARTLDANISGSGSVRYLGAPNVKQRITGTGKVTALGE